MFLLRIEFVLNDSAHSSTMVPINRPVGNCMSVIDMHQLFGRLGASQMFMLGGVSSLR